MRFKIKFQLGVVYHRSRPSIHLSFTFNLAGIEWLARGQLQCSEKYQTDEIVHVYFTGHMQLK